MDILYLICNIMALPFWIATGFFQALSDFFEFIGNTIASIFR